MQDFEIELYSLSVVFMSFWKKKSLWEFIPNAHGVSQLLINSIVIFYSKSHNSNTRQACLVCWVFLNTILTCIFPPSTQPFWVIWWRTDCWRGGWCQCRKLLCISRIRAKIEGRVGFTWVIVLGFSFNVFCFAF